MKQGKRPYWRKSTFGTDNIPMWYWTKHRFGNDIQRWEILKYKDYYAIYLLNYYYGDTLPEYVYHFTAVTLKAAKTKVQKLEEEWSK